MKQSVLRKACGILLLLLAIGIPAGVISAMGKGETQALCGSVELLTAAGRELFLYDQKGACISKLRGDAQGLCHTGELAQGEYYVAWTGGMAYFSLGEQGVTEWGGKAEVEAPYRLLLLQPDQGSVRIGTVARGRWYTYELSAGDSCYRQELNCETGERIGCLFSAIPLGTYELRENGRLLCTVELTAEKPCVSLELP